MMIDSFSKVEEENESLGQQFRQEMLHRFQHVEENVGNYSQELGSFCSTLKDQISSAATHQSTGIDTAIKHISKDLVNKEIALSENLTENANNAVSYPLQ